MHVIWKAPICKILRDEHKICIMKASLDFAVSVNIIRRFYAYEIKTFTAMTIA